MESLEIEWNGLIAHSFMCEQYNTHTLTQRHLKVSIQLSGDGYGDGDTKLSAQLIIVARGYLLSFSFCVLFNQVSISTIDTIIVIIVPVDGRMNR